MQLVRVLRDFPPLLIFIEKNKKKKKKAEVKTNLIVSLLPPMHCFDSKQHGSETPLLYLKGVSCCLSAGRRRHGAQCWERAGTPTWSVQPSVLVLISTKPSLDSSPAKQRVAVLARPPSADLRIWSRWPCRA